MKAAFTYAIRYWVTAICKTPLRTAGADGETETVLRDHNQCPFVQGSSLAGAMRNWAEDNLKAGLAKKLFGSQEQSGSLMISDGRFTTAAEQSVRPRLHIDSATGSASQGGKFDLAHINTGAVFAFDLTWMGESTESAEIPAIEKILAAMHHGQIRLGGQKSNGFGKVSLDVTKQVYNLRKEQSRRAWLSDEKQGQSLALAQLGDKKRVTFTLIGQADSILIKASAAEHGENGSYTGNLMEGGYPVLPGSSVKGAVRARASMIAGSMGRSSAMIDSLFGRGAASNDNGLPGQVWFEDVLLTRERKTKISRIRINRFTGGVMRGGLFVEEPVCSEIEMKITVPADQLAGCALVLYALRDLGLGLYNLGSGGSIGRGYLQVDQIRMQTGQDTAELNFDKNGRCTVSDPCDMVSAWMKAWKEGAQ